MDHKSELILVTGASSGIGEAIARLLSETGAQILLVGRNEDRLNRIQTELKNSLSFVCDLAKPEQVESLGGFVERHVHAHGQKFSGLVNNAGVFVRQSFEETSDASWKELWDVNMMGPVRLTKRLATLFRGPQPSAVLNISSTLGLKSVPMTSAYSAVKAAMISWTRTLALEWAKDGVRVNCLCPGMVDTPIHAFHGLSDTSDDRKFAHAMQPLGRMGTATDIAEAARFLMSAQSSWTTGATWTVDGGIHLL